MDLEVIINYWFTNNKVLKIIRWFRNQQLIQKLNESY